MSDNFYEFQHKCKAMPNNVSFAKINGSRDSQFTFEKTVVGTGLFSTILYGFRYCPYCGEDMKVENNERYDACFANGVKATLQQLDGLIASGYDLKAVCTWIDEQWEEL